MSGQKKSQEFAEVVEAYYERIFRGALSVTRDRHLAEEIVQETFLSALRKFDTFSGRSSVFTWLYRIMLNNYCKHCRRKKLLRRLGFHQSRPGHEQARSIKSSAASPAAGASNSEERELLRKAVDELPPKLRVVVAMHYFDGLPLKEAATILGCRLGTVKSRLFSARKRLCHTLEKTLQHGYENSMPKGQEAHPDCARR